MGKEAEKSNSSKPTSQPVRLYVKGVFMGFKRGQRVQHESSALVKIQGCADRKASTFYHGKRVAFVYRSKNTARGTDYKCIWGKVTTSHGNNGAVRAKFAKNLPPRAIGSTLRVMLYPNKQI